MYPKYDYCWCYSRVIRQFRGQTRYQLSSLYVSPTDDIESRAMFLLPDTFIETWYLFQKVYWRLIYFLQAVPDGLNSVSQIWFLYLETISSRHNEVSINLPVCWWNCMVWTVFLKCDFSTYLDIATDGFNTYSDVIPWIWLTTFRPLFRRLIEVSFIAPTNVLDVVS